MANIVIVTSPAFKAGKRQHERFDVHLRDTGEVICSRTRQPLPDSARVLLSRGHDSNDVILKVRSDRPEIVTMRAPIGVAAQYDVRGDKFVRRKATNSKTARIKPAQLNAGRNLPANIKK
jgi:hypothetical protein